MGIGVCSCSLVFRARWHAAGQGGVAPATAAATSGPEPCTVISRDAAGLGGNAGSGLAGEVGELRDERAR